MSAAIRTDALTKDYAVGFWRKRPYRALDGLSIDVQVRNATIRPVVGMPPITEADLKTSIKGRRVVVQVGRGIVDLGGGRSAEAVEEVGQGGATVDRRELPEVVVIAEAHAPRGDLLGGGGQTVGGAGQAGVVLEVAGVQGRHDRRLDTESLEPIEHRLIESPVAAEARVTARSGHAVVGQELGERLGVDDVELGTEGLDAEVAGLGQLGDEGRQLGDGVAQAVQLHREARSFSAHEVLFLGVGRAQSDGPTVMPDSNQGSGSIGISPSV
mgnify:CR=1 FL=1